MKRLKAGPIISRIVDNFNFALVNGTENKTDAQDNKMYMFSGHDYSIASILSTLGVFDGKRPPFASALIFELYEQKTENDGTLETIKVFF